MVRDSTRIEMFREGRWWWIGGNDYKSDLMHAIYDVLLYRMAGMKVRLYHNGRYIG